MRARDAVDEGDLHAALQHYTQALAVAPPDWPERARTEADVKAIRAWLEQGKESKESPR